MEATETWIRPGQDTVIALVHGIGAHNHQDYWRAFLEVLTADPAVSECGIFVWKYPTHVKLGRWKNLVSTVGRRTLRETAPQIAQIGAAWESTYRTHFRGYQNVFLICHSMGGLVVKSWIVDLLERGQSDSLQALRHIAFYATPHNGAPVTTLANWNKQLKDMRLDSPFIEDLGKRWDEHIVSWKDRSLRPQDRLYNRFIPHLAIAGVLDQVVPSRSATIRGIPLTTIQGDHSQTIQPTNVADTRYRVWRDAFDEFAPAGASPPPSMGQAGHGEDVIDTDTVAPASSPGEEQEYASVFISYSADNEDDEAFAQRLYADLRKHGVDCWFAPHDMRIGDKKRTRVDEAILMQKKLLLILSQPSVKSTWVEKEVETAFAKEEESHSLVLFPIMLDRVILQERAGWAADIRRQRYIGDFTRWSEDAAYQQALKRLLRDLKAEQL